MPRPFQEWASDEIRRLRAEADYLELTLKKYLASEATPKPNGSDHPGTARPAEGPEPMESPATRNRRGAKSVAKNALMLDFINKSGPHGVTADDVFRFAAEAPISIKRNASRAMLWGLNQQGRVVRRGDRYYSPNSVGPGSADPGLPLEH